MGLSYNTSKGFFSGPIKNFLPHPITMGLTSISFYGGLFIDIVADGVGKNVTIMTLPQGPVGVVQVVQLPSKLKRKFSMPVPVADAVTVTCWFGAGW